MNPLVILITLNLLAADAPAFQVETIDGRQLSGSLAAWSDEGVTLCVDGQDATVSVDDLLSLRSQKPPMELPEPPTVWGGLTDGSLLVAETMTTDNSQVSAKTRCASAVEMATSHVAYVRFQPLASERQPQWDEILAKEIDQDLLVIAKGDSLDYLGGVVQSISEDAVEFNLDGDVMPVPRTRAFAVRYYRRESASPAKPLGRLTDTDGSVWPLKEVTLDGDRLQCVTPLGVRVAIRLEDIAGIDFAASSLVYLSDLSPHSFRWTPFFGTAQEVPSLSQFYRPRTDTTLSSAPLKLDGKEYVHGLALHSRTELTYRLTESYTQLQAIAGIDDSLRPRGNVRLEVLGDDRTLLETTVVGSEPAQPIEVQLDGVTTLKIIVDFGSDLDIADHLILAEAKLLK